jgi:hypothetical protein
MTLENLYRRSLLPFRQHLLVAKGIFRSSLRVLLYLAGIPFLSYSFMYLYIGDGTVASILAIPRPIAMIIFLLNFLVFLILVPFVMTLVQRFVHNQTYLISDMFLSVRRRILPLLLGFFLLGLGVVALFTLVWTIIPLFTSQLGFTLFSLLYFTFIMYLYLNFLFWSHFVVLGGTNTWIGFKNSRALFKKHGKWMLAYALSLAFLSLLVLNGAALLISGLITNAMAASIALAFIQSLVLIFSQIVLTSLFMNLSLLGSEESESTAI